jgi:hypothetical protein
MMKLFFAFKSFFARILEKYMRFSISLFLITGCGNNHKTSISDNGEPPAHPNAGPPAVYRAINEYMELAHYGSLPDWSLFEPAWTRPGEDIRRKLLSSTGHVLHYLEKEKAAMKLSRGHKKVSRLVPMYLAGLREITQSLEQENAERKEKMLGSGLLMIQRARELTAQPVSSETLSQIEKDNFNFCVKVFGIESCRNMIIEFLIAEPLILSACTRVTVSSSLGECRDAFNLLSVISTGTWASQGDAHKLAEYLNDAKPYYTSIYEAAQLALYDKVGSAEVDGEIFEKTVKFREYTLPSMWAHNKKN